MGNRLIHRREYFPYHGLPLYGVQVLVFRYLETFHDKAVRVVVTPYGVQQPATGDKASFRHATFTDNHLPGIGSHRIRVHIEIARNTVYPYGLADIARNDTVIISLFREVTVIIKCALVGKEQRPFDIAFDSVLIRGQCKKSS